MWIERSARARLVFGLASVALLAAVGCGGGESPTTPLAATPVAVAPTPVPSPKVVILSVDGLRGDAIAKAEAPNLKGLVLRGAYTWTARTVSPSETLPGHASMLSGEDPRVHKITWDSEDYKPEKGHITVPTVFSVARAAGQRTVAVIGKRKLQHLAPPGTVDSVTVAERGDRDVANEAIVQAGVGFDLLFVHFPDVDHAGHGEGWMSAAYLAKVAEADEAIGRLLAVLPAHATVILTADHGGRGRNHGQDHPENTMVPWIVAGPKVVRRGEMTARVKQTDTALTALWLLGLGLPGGCAGEVVREPFTAPAP